MSESERQCDAIQRLDYCFDDLPIDDHTGRSRLFVMIHNEHDRLMKDSAELFVRHQDTSLFNVRNRMRPSMGVDDRVRFHVNGQLGRAHKGILIQEIFGLRNADRIALEQAAAASTTDSALVGFLGRMISENGRNGSAKQITELSLFVERVAIVLTVIAAAAAAGFSVVLWLLLGSHLFCLFLGH